MDKARQDSFTNDGPHLGGSKDTKNEEAEDGTWPASLRRYLQRAFDNCNKAQGTRQYDQLEKALHRIVTDAMADNSMLTTDWDNEPLPRFAAAALLTVTPFVYGVNASYSYHYVVGWAVNNSEHKTAYHARVLDHLGNLTRDSSTCVIQSRRLLHDSWFTYCVQGITLPVACCPEGTGKPFFAMI